MRHSLVLIALVGAGLPDKPSAQVTLEVLQGTTWASKLTIPQLQPMSFRWKWSGPQIKTASFELVTFSPVSYPNLPPTRTGSLAVPPKGEYSSNFVIRPHVSYPSTFYVRITTSAGSSSWVPILVARRATITLP